MVCCKNKLEKLGICFCNKIPKFYVKSKEVEVKTTPTFWRVESLSLILFKYSTIFYTKKYIFLKN